MKLEEKKKKVTRKKDMSVLSQADIIGIEQKAKDVLLSVYKKVEEIKPPIDISKILSANSFKVESGEFDDEDVVGYYDKKAKKISVSSDDIYQRQIFTVAHELGHFFLHADKEEEVFYRTQVINLDSEKQKEEAEANWFAASLLMPKNLVLKYWELTKDIDIIAKIFGVSHTAAYFRLKNLQLAP